MLSTITEFSTELTFQEILIDRSQQHFRRVLSLEDESQTASTYLAEAADCDV